MRGRTVRVTLAILALVAAFQLLTQHTGAQEKFDLEKAVSGAKTAADHEAIAAYYEREAAAAKDKSAEHRRLVEAYHRLAATPRGQGFQSMGNHCQQLAKNYESVAAQNTALATAHRKMAQAAAQQK